MADLRINLDVVIVRAAFHNAINRDLIMCTLNYRVWSKILALIS